MAAEPRTRECGTVRFRAEVQNIRMDINRQQQLMDGWNRAQLNTLNADPSKRWVYTLAENDLRDINAGLKHALLRDPDFANLAAVDFPCGEFDKRLATIRRSVESGCGVALIKGLPVDSYSTQEAATAFLGVGCKFGRALAQNAFGDIVGHVTDLGGDWKAQMTTRGYETTQLLPFHTDSCDIVGLLCLKEAKEGGISSIVCSPAVHDALLERRPDLLELLYESWYVDRRGEEPQGERPYYRTPIFAVHRGRLYARYNRTYIESAQRFEAVPRLTKPQREALDALDEACANPAYRFDMQLERGDMQFLNNYKVLHSRTQYVDFEQPELKRHLLRLWLFSPRMADIPTTFRERYRDMEAWQSNPRLAIKPDMRGVPLQD
jgi:hypothetical protein